MPLRDVIRSCALILVLASSSGAEQKYDFDDAHALVRFTVKLAGVSDVEGRFIGTDAAITYNEDDLTKSSVTAFIPVAGIDTGEKERDDHLRTADFFDAKKFPFITFQSKRIEKRGADWAIVGDLTIHGVTHEIELPFQRVQKKYVDSFGNDRIGFEAHTIIKRKDYGIAGPEFWGMAISDDVDILLRVTARIYNWNDISGSPARGKRSFIPELLLLFEKGDAAAPHRLSSVQSDPKGEYDLREWQFHVLGRKLFQHGKIKEAAEVFERYVAAYPKSATALDDLADAREALGDRKQALALYQKAVELNPHDAGAVENVRTIRP
jgi:polyisoprenoid-binding protein YceI